MSKRLFLFIQLLIYAVISFGQVSNLMINDNLTIDLISNKCFSLNWNSNAHLEEMNAYSVSFIDNRFSSIKVACDDLDYPLLIINRVTGNYEVHQGSRFDVDSLFKAAGITQGQINNISAGCGKSAWYETVYTDNDLKALKSIIEFRPGAPMMGRTQSGIGIYFASGRLNMIDFIDSQNIEYLKILFDKKNRISLIAVRDMNKGSYLLLKQKRGKFVYRNR